MPPRLNDTITFQDGWKTSLPVCILRQLQPRLHYRQVILHVTTRLRQRDFRRVDVLPVTQQQQRFPGPRQLLPERGFRGVAAALLSDWQNCQRRAGRRLAHMPIHRERISTISSTNSALLTARSHKINLHPALRFKWVCSLSFEHVSLGTNTSISKA